MKKVIYLFFILFGIFSFSQDFKKTIAQEACKCVKENVKEGSTEKQTELQFGICMFKVSSPYKKEIKNEFGIDLNDFTNKQNMYELGKQFGMIMALECPEVFEKFMDKENSISDNYIEENTTDLLMHGEVAKIDKDAFVIFYLKGDNGILTKFYWVSNVESNIELEKKYNELVGKKVNVSYYSTDIFDYKISEYRKVNILTMLKTE